MADYYPLIARAIAGLDPSAPGESRRALYERARTALIAQLRGVQPPLSESEITRERLSLEEAVRKVESEAAQRARDASRPGGAARGSCRRAAAMRSAAPMPARRTRSRHPSAPRPSPRARDRRRRRPSRDARPPLGQDDPQRGSAICAPRRRRLAAPAAAATADAGSGAAADPRTLRRAAPRPRHNAPQMPQSPGMRGFRDIAADADDLGRAAATANRNARKTYANVPSPSPEFDRIEPGMENRGADPEAPYSYDESLEEADRYAPSRRSRGSARGSASAAIASRRSAPAPVRCFRSRARSRSASCWSWSASGSSPAGRSSTS